jgi:N-formylglutamate deformylase
MANERTPALSDALSSKEDAASALVPGQFLTRAATAPPPSIVLTSPHSGRAYPPAFRRESALDLMGLRRAEDAFVDTLLEPAVAALGLPLVAARWGRAFIDLNRAPEELDLSLLVDPGEAGTVASSERVRSGLGVLPRVTGPGLRTYSRKIPTRVALGRLAAVHAPYHARIEALLGEAVSANGYALLVDCHSMPSLPLAESRRPHFVIGDLGGRSAASAVTQRVETRLRLSGYRTARNTPYAGGYTTRRHAAPERGIHAVQIEIDRALYMDCGTLVPHAGFQEVADALSALLLDLTSWLPGFGSGRASSIAAE